jgi:hypothetical protein
VSYIIARDLFIGYKERSKEAKEIKLHYFMGVIDNGRGRIMDIHIV